MHLEDYLPARAAQFVTFALVIALFVAGMLWLWPLVLFAIFPVWWRSLGLDRIYRLIVTAILLATIVPTASHYIDTRLLGGGCSNPEVIGTLRQLIPRIVRAQDIGPLLRFSAIRTVSRSPAVCRVDVDFTETGSITGLYGVRTGTYRISMTDAGETYVEVEIQRMKCIQQLVRAVLRTSFSRLVIASPQWAPVVHASQAE